MSTDPGESWYVRSRGKVLGPFAFRQLEILRDKQRLAKFDEVSRGDRRSWVVASTMPELFPTVLTGAGPVGAEQVEPSYSVIPDPDVAVTQGWYHMTELGQSPKRTLVELIGLVRSGVVTPETLVWSSELPDWQPARSVPALGPFSSQEFSKVDAKPVAIVAMTTVSPGGIGFAISGFILSLLGILCASLAFLTVLVLPEASRNREILGMVLVGLLIVWAVSSLLSVVFGSLAMLKASRAGEGRRGFGLGLTSLILGLLGLAGLIVLIFLTAVGMIGFVQKPGI